MARFTTKADTCTNPKSTLNSHAFKPTIVKHYRNLLGAALLLAVVLSSCTTTSKESGTSEGSTAEVSNTPNSLTSGLTAEGWELLFDGETLTGWKRFNHDTIGPLWSVQNGTILCDGEGLGEGSGAMGGSLVTTRTFGNFDLMLDYKLSEGGNSGILYHVVEDPKYKYDYETGPEFQLLD